MAAYIFRCGSCCIVIRSKGLRNTDARCFPLRGRSSTGAKMVRHYHQIYTTVALIGGVIGRLCITITTRIDSMGGSTTDIETLIITRRLIHCCTHRITGCVEGACDRYRVRNSTAGSTELSVFFAVTLISVCFPLLGGSSCHEFSAHQF